MKLLGATAFLVTLTASASAVDNASIAKCAIVDGDLARLSCFDDLARDAGLDGPKPMPVPDKSATAGKWSVDRDKNPIDDTERVVLRLTADSGVSRWNDEISFIARCRSNETEAYIVWNDYLGNDGDHRNEFKNVTVRIGDDKATVERWTLSTDSKATFAPEWAGTLLQKMAASDRFIAQVTPYNESPVTAIFDTTGMAAALEPLMEVCKWSL